MKLGTPAVYHRKSFTVPDVELSQVYFTRTRNKKRKTETANDLMVT